MNLRLCLAAFAIVATVAAAATQDLPKPTGRINDFAGVLDQPSESQLDSLLAALETDTTAQVAVVTMDSLDGANVEEDATTLSCATVSCPRSATTTTRPGS